MAAEMFPLYSALDFIININFICLILISNAWNLRYP